MLKLQECDADFYIRGGHQQTLLGYLIPSPPLKGRKQIFFVDLPDGDKLHCTLISGTSPYVISLYHGLAGDSQSDYMRRSANLCQDLGHTVVLVNHRGAGEGFLYSRQSYHSGRADDMSAVIKYLRESNPSKKQIAIGFSMSANILLSLMGGFLGEHLPDAGIAVNGPINLGRSSHLLSRGLNRVYDLNFIHNLRRYLRNKQKAGLADVEFSVSPLMKVHEFDEIYTAPAGGFESADHYYRSCSAKQYVHRIDRPVHVLTAQNDPFICVDDYRDASFSSSCFVRIEKTGGHMGYLSSQLTPLGTHRWLDYYLYEAVQHLTKG